MALLWPSIFESRLFAEWSTGVPGRVSWTGNWIVHVHVIITITLVRSPLEYNSLLLQSEQMRSAA